MSFYKILYREFLNIVLIAFICLAINWECDSSEFDNPHKSYSYNYKGQIHSHSKRSDGGQNAYDVIQAYKNAGYHFCFLTDHFDYNPPKLKQEEIPTGILYIPGDELDDPVTSTKHHILSLGIEMPKPKEFTDFKDILNTIYKFNTVAVLAHPGAKSGYTFEEISKKSIADWYLGIEIYNATCMPSSGWEPQWYINDYWEPLLKASLKKWCFSVDDCHNVINNKGSFNRAWIVVNSQKGPLQDFLGAPEKQKEIRDDIIKNIKTGNFYSVVRSPNINGDSPSLGTADLGPKLTVAVTEDKVIAATDLPSNISFVCDGEIGGSFTNVTYAIYKSNGQESYVRVEIEQKRADGETYRAYSQPLFRIK